MGHRDLHFIRAAGDGGDAVAATQFHVLPGQMEGDELSGGVFQRGAVGALEVKLAHSGGNHAAGLQDKFEFFVAH